METMYFQPLPGVMSQVDRVVHIAKPETTKDDASWVSWCEREFHPNLVEETVKPGVVPDASLAEPGAPCMVCLMLFVSAVEKPDNSTELPAAGVDGESISVILHRTQWMLDDVLYLLPKDAVGNEECRRLATNVYDLANTIRRQAAQPNSEPPGREF